jgi:hypothetical protein
MTKQDKFIGGITIAHAVLGIVWVTWVASQLGFPLAFLGLNLALASAGAVAGIGWLRNIRWASLLLLLFYAIQLVHIITPGFQFSFTLGFNLNVAVGWFAPAAELDFNLFALAMLVWASLRPRFKDGARLAAISGGA